MEQGKRSISQVKPRREGPSSKCWVGGANRRITAPQHPWRSFAASVFLGFLLLIGLFSVLSFPVVAAGITVSKDVSSDEVQAGEPFTFTIHATNTTGNQISLIISDVIPSGLTVVNFGGGSLNQGAIVWPSTFVNHGSTLDVVFSVYGTEAGEVVNEVYQASSTPNYGSGPAVPVTIVAGEPGDLDLSVSPNPAPVGTEAQLVITATDAFGNLVADGTTVSIVFDGGTIDGNPAGTPVNATTSSGRATKTLVAGSTTGTKHITASAGSALAVTTLSLTPGAPSSLDIVASPTSIPVGGASQSTITATVTDSFGNAVGQTPVTVTTNLGQLNGSGASVVVQTDSGGHALATLRGNVAGTAHIQAQAPSLPMASTDVVLTPGPPDHLAVQADPATLTADGVSTSTILLSILDAYDNRVNTSVAVTLTTNLGTFSGGGQTFVAFTSSGQVSTIVHAGTVAGSAAVGASAAGLNTSATIDMVPGPPNNLSLEVRPTSITADGASTAALTATVKDVYGNAVATPVSVTLSSSGGTILPDASGATTNGILARQLRSSILLGTVSITATSPGLTPPATGTIDFVVGAPDNAEIVLSPAQPITAGHVVSMSVTVFDSVGHVVPSVPISMSVSLASVLPSPYGTTDANGLIQRTLVSTHSGAETIEVRAANGVLSVTGGNVTFVPDSPTTAVLAASTSQLFADGNTTAVISATIKDQYGNVIPGVTPVFFTTLGSLSGNTASNAAGVVTRTLHSSTALGTANVSIPALWSPQPVSVAFVAGPPAVASLEVSEPTAYVYNVGSTYKPDVITCVLTISDSVGHPVVGATPAVTSTFGTVSGTSATDTRGILTRTLKSTVAGQPQVFVAGSIHPSGPTITFLPGPLDRVVISPLGSVLAPVPATSGVPKTFTATAQDVYGNVLSGRSFTWTVSSSGGNGIISPGGVFTGTTAGTVRIRAATGDETGVSMVLVGPGASAAARIAASPRTLPADGTSHSTLVFHITDSYGNAVGAGRAITVSNSIGALEGSGLTDAGGATTRTIRSTQAGLAVIRVTNLATTTGHTVIVFTPGEPASASVSAAPSEVPANGMAQSTLRVTLKDIYGNPVSAGYQPVVVSSLGTMGTILPNWAQTDNYGTVTRTLIAPLVVGTAEFTVTYSGSPLTVTGDSVAFVVGPMDQLRALPAGPLSVESGRSVSFSAQAYDDDDAPLPADRLTYGWDLVFNGSGEGILDASPKFGALTVFTGTVIGSGIQLIAWADEGGSYVETPVNISVIPGAAVTGTVSIVPSSVEADAVSTYTISLDSLADHIGNQADGSILTVTVDSLPLSRTTTATIHNGQAAAALASTVRAGTYTVSVTSARGHVHLSGDPRVTFVPGPPSHGEVLSATPAQIVADGASTATVVIQVIDTFANPVAAGHSPVLSSTLGSILPGYGLTDQNGVLTCTFRAGQDLGSAVILMNGSLTSGERPELIPGPPAQSTFNVGETTLVVGGQSTPVTIVIRDAWGHLVVDHIVITPTVQPSPPASGDWGSLSGVRETSNGVINQVLRSGTSAGTVFLGTQGISASGETLVTYIPGPARWARIQAVPSTLMVEETAALTITLSDEYGNVVTPTVTRVAADFGVLDGTAGIVTKTSTAGTGMITVTLSSTIAGTDTLTIVRPGEAVVGIDPTSDDIVFLPDEPVGVVLSPTGPITIAAGSLLTVTVSSLDRHGNAVDPWDPVEYSWWQAAASGQPGYGTITSIDPHSRSVRFWATTIGRNHLWATGGITVSPVLSVNVVAGAPAAAAVSVSPHSVPADGATAFVVNLTSIVDGVGNPVPDGTPVTVTVASVPPVSASGYVHSSSVTFTLLSSTDAGDYVVVASGSDGAMTLSGNDAISFDPGAPTQATIVAYPTTVPGDGSSTSALTVTVRDAYANLVADGTPITVTSSMGTVLGTGSTVNGGVNRTLVAPIALGTAQLSVAGPGGILFAAGDSVEFVPGPSALADVTAAPAWVVADGSSTSFVTIMIQDANGFATHGTGPASLSVMRGSIVPTQTTASNGIITATFTSDMSIGVAGLAVNYEGDELGITGDILEQVSGPAVTSTIVALPTTLGVGNLTGSVLTATLRDTWERTIPDGTVVTITTSLGSIATQQRTTVSGVVTATFLPGTTMGTAHFTIHTEGGSLVPSGDTITITSGSLNYIEIAPLGPLTMTACTTKTFTAVGRDQYGNETGTGLFNWILWAGTGNGVLRNGVFTATKSGLVNIQASQSYFYSPHANVTIVPGPAVTATIKASSVAIPVGTGTSVLTITVRDNCGNLVADGTALNVTTSVGTISGSSTTFQGVATRTLHASNYYGMATIFVDGWQPAGDRVTMTAGGVYLVGMTANPTTLTADGVSTSVLRISLADAAGMPIADGTTPVLTTTLGTLSGSGGSIGSILTRTLRASVVPGTAHVYVNGILASGSVDIRAGQPARVLISADPYYLPADGNSASVLTFHVQDQYGNTLTTSNTLDVTASLGTLGGETPTVDGVTTRILTASAEAGVARISVAGLMAAGDVGIHFVGDTLENGGFEDGMDFWSGDGERTVPSTAPCYSTAVVSSWTVDGIVITPHSGDSMIRMGATTDDNTSHAVGYTLLRQPFLVPATGLTQITFWYRLMSYDVSIGSATNSYLRWDPFETVLGGDEVLEDGYPFSDEWYQWYLSGPDEPNDMGWKQGVLDVTDHAGTITTLEFLLPNGQAAVDNTWVFVDDVALTNKPAVGAFRTFAPVIITSR